MNRLISRFSLPGMAALLVLLTAASPARGGISTGPQSTNTVTAEQQRKQQFFDAEYSFQQKLRVGRERYEQKQAHRAQVVAAMNAQFAARQEVIVTSPIILADSRIAAPTNWALTVIPMLGLLAGLVGVRHRMNQRALSESSSKPEPVPELYLGPALEPEASVAIPSKAEAILTCKVCGADARGRCVDGGFLVAAGSVCVKGGAGPALTKAAEAVRSQLLISGVLGHVDEKFIFLEDHVFATPTLAAAAVLGTPANGFLIWKTEDGITLERLERGR